MSVYRYQADSTIQRIIFETSAKGGVVAYLSAGALARPERLADIAESMREKRWFCTPTEHHGKHVLEVRKFGKEHDLISALEGLQAVHGVAHVDQSQSSLIPNNPIEFVKNRSLHASGIMQTFGDTCFFMYGLKGRSLGDTLAGVLYNIGTLELLFYGRNDQSNREIKEISHKLNDYLESYSIQAPIRCSLKSITEENKGGFLYNTKELLERYPSEIYNIFTGLAGLGVAAAATTKMRHTPRLTDAVKARETLKAAKWDVGLGLATFASTMFGLVVKEKKIDPDQPPPETSIGRIWQKIQERPLRVTGSGLMFSTICHAISTATEYKEALRTHDREMLSTVPWRAGFVAANLIAELLLIISSKGHGEGVLSDKSVQDSIYASAAELIRAQAPEKRNEAFQHVVEFLGRSDVFAESSAEVAGEIRKRMASQEVNPWACHNLPREAASGMTPKTEVQQPHIKGGQATAASLAGGLSGTDWQPGIQGV